LAIAYHDTKNFRAEELKKLFSSVGWSSADHPERLKNAMAGSDTVFSAWDGEMLVGLMNALSDGSMNVYFHYLLVHPDYHGLGIGRELVEKMKKTYKEYLRLVLIAYDKEAGFYEKCGFTRSLNSSPMFITELTT
jgi:GNAT superfamily N-acetyltransferase